MVHPVVLALKYVVLKDNSIAYQVDYMWSEDNRSLCFECIEKKIPAGRKRILNEIYACYEAETEFRKIQDSEKGGWVPIDSTFPETYSRFEQKYKNIAKECLFCDKDPKKGLPYFRPLVIDRVESGKRPSLCGSYQCSHLERGMTSFNICFEDFRKNFPRCFETLSKDLLGTRDKDSKLEPNTIYLPKGYRQAMEGKKQKLDWIIESTTDFVVFRKKLGCEKERGSGSCKIQIKDP